jgi:hypothetical protein
MTQVPHWPWRQTRPEPQVMPSGCSLQLVVERAGSHSSQASAGLTAPAAKPAPLMKQPAAHAPPPQTSPRPQGWPLGSLLQAVVEVAGVHTWHGFAGFTVPAGTVTPLMAQTPHWPSLQTRPPPQLWPLGSLLQLVVESAGVQTWHEFVGLTVPAGNALPPM